MKPKRSILILLLVGAAAVSACSKPEAVNSSVQKVNRALTVNDIRALAEQGDANAQYDLCLRYDTSEGVHQDYQEALRWCRLAAAQGDGRAMYTIGRYYHKGLGVTKDLVQAHKWYNLAASVGYSDGAKWRDRLVPQMTADQINDAQRLAREWKPSEKKPSPNN